jgi:hopanoid biosynthesis associated protein HpnK
MKCLVINADDFGFDPSINAAIAQAHTAGLLTSASLMVGAQHTGPAIEFARAHPALGIGIHLCLVEVRPVSALDAIAALTDSTGALPRSPFELVRKLSGNTRAVAAAEIELRTQVEKFMATGLRPTHLDTHQHTHLNSKVLEIVIRLAREYRIPWIRGPVEPLGRSLHGDRRHPCRTLARWPVFRLLGTRCVKRIRQSGLATTDSALGILNAGQITEDFLLATLPCLTDGVTEVVCHPATDSNAQLQRCQPGYQPAAELRALCSLRVKALIEAGGIRLVNFRQLAEMASPA